MLDLKMSEKLAKWDDRIPQLLAIHAQALTEISGCFKLINKKNDKIILL